MICRLLIHRFSSLDFWSRIVEGAILVCFIIELFSVLYDVVLAFKVCAETACGGKFTAVLSRTVRVPVSSSTPSGIANADAKF